MQIQQDFVPEHGRHIEHKKRLRPPNGPQAPPGCDIWVSMAPILTLKTLKCQHP